MPFSKTQVCNLALNSIGQESIVTFDEDSKNGELCRLCYDFVLLLMLNKSTWKFSKRRITLDQEELPPPAWGYLHRFALPSDCLRVIMDDDEYTSYNCSQGYKIEDNYVLTNSDSVNILYVSKDVNIQHASPVFISAFVARLAAQMVIRGEGTESMLQNMTALEQERFLEAALIEDNEGSYAKKPSSWIDVRYTYGR